MYPLKEVLLLVICATIASCDDFDDIVAWGKHHLAVLRRFSEFHHGIPCERWLRNLVNRIDPVLFGRCFNSWVAALWPRPARVHRDRRQNIAPHPRSRKGLKALHTLSAYATNARLTLAQLSVPEKTNEITAIPELLDQLAETKQLEGALVTIDAMGCQVEIADKIVAHKADYLLALKGNQPTLEADVEDYFRTAPLDELVTKTSVEKGHGRIETRTYTASSKVDWIKSERSYPGQPHFNNIKSIVKVHTRAEYPDRCSFETRYYICPPHSTSNASPGVRGAIGASRACIGCSMSSSATTCRATAPAMAPKTWLSSAASHSVLCAPTKIREASKHDVKTQAGAQTFCYKSCSSKTVNLDSGPCFGGREGFVE